MMTVCVHNSTNGKYTAFELVTDARNYEKYNKSEKMSNQGEEKTVKFNISAW